MLDGRTLVRTAIGITTALATVGALSPAAADDLVLVEGVGGYDGVRDNTIYSDSNVLSNGSGDHIFAGNTARGQTRRALIRFDLENLLPPDAVINSVTLRLVTSRTRATPSNRVQSLHVVSVDWGEGSEDAGGPEGTGTTGTMDTATWNSNFLGTSLWTNLGGDFNPTPSASAQAGGTNQPAQWSTAQMVSDVETWLADPSSNFGWEIIGNETRSTTAVRYYSADNNEGAPIDRKPRLTINYTTGAIDLAATALQRGQQATLTASNCVPQSEVFFTYSFAGPGSTFVPQLGISLDMALPIQIGGSATADASGVAVFTQTVPPNAPLTTVSLQATHLRLNDVARKSNRVDTSITP